MSYILDALRKSEQERQVAAGQSASALYPVMVESNRPRIAWTQLLAAMGAAVVAALAFWGWRSQPSVPSTPAPVYQAAAPARQAAPPTAMPPAPAPQAELAPVIPNEPRMPEADAAKPRATRAADPPAKAAARVAVPPGEGQIPPVPVQEDLPPLRIAGYIRDEEGGSMAMINDRLVREGEEISPGLRLETILPDGAIFSFKGRRFNR
jgi:general secretion pathway protein B